MNGQDPLLDEIMRRRIELRDMFFKHYIDHELFSPTWWLTVVLLIVPLVVWWKMADKRRLLELCVFGLLVNVASSFLDVAGSEYVLWDYPVHTLPQISLLIPVDYVIVPVVGMMIYQKFPKWKGFLLACTVAGFAMSFLCEPFAVFIGLYKLILWRYVYSFPIYILIYLAAKLMTGKLADAQAKSK